MMSFYIARGDKAAIEQLADDRGETQADTVRAMLAFAQRRMPPNWKPPKETG